MARRGADHRRGSAASCHARPGGQERPARERLEAQGLQWDADAQAGAGAGSGQPVYLLISDIQAERMAELPLCALRAVEDHARRLVVGEVGGPALLVGRQPEGIALSAARNQRDLLGAHRASL
jgi:hypothetical protein